MQQKTWWKEAVVYQIYPRSYQDSTGNGIGDLKGITSRLDHLKELGINVVWLSPCYKSPNDDGGYDISDYQSIMEDFGTMADFDEMLKGMHERGIKLVMDLVVNHSSDEHYWFKESRSSLDNPKRDYYIWRPGKNGGPPNNWTSCFGGSAWEYDKTTDQYFLHLFSKKQPDLNWESQNLRNEVFKMMTFWFEKGIDGFRMDVISFISKVPGYPDGNAANPLSIGGEMYINGPHVHDYLREMNEKVLSKYDCLTVGECPCCNIEHAKKYTGFDSKELTMVFQFDLMDVDSGEGTKFNLRQYKLTDFKKIITNWQTGLDGCAWNSNYLSNHDQPRPVSRFGNDTPEFRELSAKMLGTMNHTLQGTPYIYQGEEIGMTNVPFSSIDEFKDLETLNFWRDAVLKGYMTKEKAMEGFRAKGRDNARTPMQWDSSKNSGFSTAEPWLKVNPNYTTINVEEAKKNPNSVFHYYQKLIQLRHQHDIIVYGKYQEYYPESEDLFVYTRTLGNQLLFVALNFTKNEQSLKIPDGVNIAGAKLLISNYENNDTIPSKLRPYEAIVYLK